MLVGSHDILDTFATHAAMLVGSHDIIHRGGKNGEKKKKRQKNELHKICNQKHASNVKLHLKFPTDFILH